MRGGPYKKPAWFDATSSRRWDGSRSNCGRVYLGSTYVGLRRDGSEVGGAKPRTRPLQAKMPVRKDFDILLKGQAVGLWKNEEMDEVGKTT